MSLSEIDAAADAGSQIARDITEEWGAGSGAEEPVLDLCQGLTGRDQRVVGRRELAIRPARDESADRCPTAEEVLN